MCFTMLLQWSLSCAPSQTDAADTFALFVGHARTVKLTNERVWSGFMIGAEHKSYLGNLVSELGLRFTKDAWLGVVVALPGEMAG